MIPYSDIPTHDLSNLARFSLADLALLHETTEAEVRRVAANVLNLRAQGPFSFDDLLRVNRILGPPPEPSDILWDETL